MLSRAVLTATYGLAKEAAVDSLCLLQLGYSAKDKDLINEGRVRYNAAVAKLRFELGKVGAIHDDGVLGTTYILGCCDFYQAVPYRQTSFTHLYGMRTLLELRGPDDSYSPFAKLVVNNMRALLAVYGMSERKAVPFHCAKWRDRIPMPPDAQGKLSRLVAGVPGLMERTDVCLRRTPVNPSELDDVLLQLSVHESNLQEWYLAWLRSFEESPYRLVSIRKFPHFQRHGPSTSQVFPMVLEFPSFAKASCLTAYWIGLLHLKQQLLDLLALKCSGELNERKTLLRADCAECALRLVQSVAFLTQAKYGHCGALRATRPLHWASRWFASDDETEKAACCSLISSGMGTSSGGSLYVLAVADESQDSN